MVSDLLRPLCALMAFVFPLGVAWSIVLWQSRPKKARNQDQDQDQDQV